MYRRRQVGGRAYNLKDLRLDLEDVENRAQWKKRTCVTDPSREGSTT